MKIYELVTQCARAAESSDGMRAVRAILEGLKDNLEDVERSLSYVSGVGGNARQVFYRSPELTMLKVCFPAGRRTPPHDHGTWATILLLSGEEKNTLYRREDGVLRKAGEMTLTRGPIRCTSPNASEANPPSAFMSTAATSSNSRAGCGIRRN